MCTFSEKGVYSGKDVMDFVCNNHIKKKRTQVSCELGERIWNIQKRLEEKDSYFKYLKDCHIDGGLGFTDINLMSRTISKLKF